MARGLAVTVVEIRSLRQATHLSAHLPLDANRHSLGFRVKKAYIQEQGTQIIGGSRSKGTFLHEKSQGNRERHITDTRDTHHSHAHSDLNLQSQTPPNFGAISPLGPKNPKPQL